MATPLHLYVTELPPAATGVLLAKDARPLVIRKYEGKTALECIQMLICSALQVCRHGDIEVFSSNCWVTRLFAANPKWFCQGKSMPYTVRCFHLYPENNRARKLHRVEQAPSLLHERMKKKHKSGTPQREYTPYGSYCSPPDHSKSFQEDGRNCQLSIEQTPQTLDRNGSFDQSAPAGPELDQDDRGGSRT